MLCLLVYSSIGDSVTPPIKLLGCRVQGATKFCSPEGVGQCLSRTRTSVTNVGNVEEKLVAGEILSNLALSLGVVENVDINTQLV